jgi:hypothetical protein
MPALAPRAGLASRPAARATAPRRPARGAPLVCRADSVLIANTKGGGHAFLGLHLARKLVADGHSVTILNDGEEVRGNGGFVGAGKGRKSKPHARFLVRAPRPRVYHASSPHAASVDARPTTQAGTCGCGGCIRCTERA